MSPSDDPRAERLRAAEQRARALRDRVRKVDLLVDAVSSVSGPVSIPVRPDGSVRKLDAGTQRALTRLASVYELHPVWEEFSGKGVTVAVLDTGITPDHPLLDDVLARDAEGRPVCRSFVGADSAASEGDLEACRDDDAQGHGTHTAGIIAARALPGLEEFRGIAPEVKLVVAKVLDENGNGGLDAVAQAITWASSRADILNLSLAAMQSTDRLYRAIHGALAAGKIIVCAAGNRGGVPGELAYPARYGGVISVAAHDAFGQPVRFSSRGGEIDFAALGEDVWSTGVADGEPCLTRASGTSIAAPVVSAIAALVLSKHRQFDELRAAALRAGDSEAADRFVNRTPIRNNEDMREHLLRLASSRIGHSDSLGYGPLWPGRLFSS